MSIMHQDRVDLYGQIESERKSKVITYVTGDRPHMETQVSPEVIDFFVHHLDRIGVTPKISLFLHTMGGDVSSAWRIVNLLRTFCDELEVIIPSKALSAGTLMCLGADRIMMTKQAIIGPIDPSVNTPLNPLLPGTNNPTARVPVSVEDLNSFMEFVKTCVIDNVGMSSVLSKLADTIHPLVLGNAYRRRSQIRMLGEKLLKNHVTDADKIKQLLDFLCSDSGSHDYSINRREGLALGLPIEKPSQVFYDNIIRPCYASVAKQLEFSTPYEPLAVLGASQTSNYSLSRALIESRAGGCHVFMSEGILGRQQILISPGVTQETVSDNRSFEGWRHFS